VELRGEYAEDIHFFQFRSLVFSLYSQRLISPLLTPPFITLVLDGGEWLASSTSRFASGETARGAYCVGDWVGPKGGLDFLKKRKISCPCLELNPDSSPVQPVASSLYRLIYIYIYNENDRTEAVFHVNIIYHKRSKSSRTLLDAYIYNILRVAVFHSG
jgi:hypothetical protein